MSEMIERVARQLEPAAFDPWTICWPPKRGRQAKARRRAWLLINVMREPTLNMLDAGWIIGGPDSYDDLADSWRDMIDEALKRPSAPSPTPTPAQAGFGTDDGLRQQAEILDQDDEDSMDGWRVG